MNNEQSSTVLDIDEGPWKGVAATCGVTEAWLSRAIWKTRSLPYKTINSVPRETVVRVSDVEKLLAAKRHPAVTVHAAETGPLAEVAS